MLFLANSASCPTWKAQNVSLEWLFNKFHQDAKLPKMTLWMGQMELSTTGTWN